MAIYNMLGKAAPNLYTIHGDPVHSAYDTNGNYIPSDPYLNNRLLIFEDNFLELDDSVWTAEVGNMRGNFFCREQNVAIENNQLVITIKKENHGGKNWTSGSLITRGKKSWMYGRFEAKLKATGIRYFNSAFWFLGNSIGEILYNDDGTRPPVQREGVENWTGWSACGEIDALETQSNPNRPTCNLWNNAGKSISGGTFSKDIDITNWHVYAIEWTNTYIAAFVDGQEYKRWTFSDYSEAAVKAYTTEPIAIYLGVGTNEWLDPTGTPDEGKMYVDWVRVYAPAGETEEILDQSISIQPALTLKKGYVTYTAPVILPLDTSDRSIVWASSDESVVICENGFIQGINIGEADITVISHNNHQSTCHVTVVSA